MKILFMGNNRVGLETLKWLVESGLDQVVGVVVHAADQQRHGEEIVAIAENIGAEIFEGNRLREREVLGRIESLAPDIGLSMFFGYILKADLLDLIPKGIINLHPSYLPFNRGQYPNVWSIVEGTPAGVSLHYVDAGIDTGDVIAQQLVPCDPADTGESLYRKLETASIELFQMAWPAIREGRIARKPQLQQGTAHRTRDVARIDKIDLDRLYRAGDLINIIRARTFPPYDGAYFEVDGERIYLRLDLYRRDPKQDS